MFSNSRKVAQGVVSRMIGGHCSLVAWWTLKQAGVLSAIVEMEREAGEGLDARVHAVRKNLAPDLLFALVEYLGSESAGLLSMAGNKASLSAEGKALLEHDDGILDFVRACEPALAAAEHLLAKLKTPAGATGVRRSEGLRASRARRQGKELFAAIAEVGREQKCSHVFDTACGGGELLLSLAAGNKAVVGVGIAADDEAAHGANTAFAAAGLEKRLIAIPASATEVLADTPRAFERLGISRALWGELDMVVMPQLWGDGPRDAEGIAGTVAAARKHFPRAALVVVEAVESAELEKNYYAAEYQFLLRMARAPLWTADQWQDVFRTAKVVLTQEIPLVVDGLMVFVSPRPGRRAAAAT